MIYSLDLCLTLTKASTVKRILRYFGILAFALQVLAGEAIAQGVATPPEATPKTFDNVNDKVPVIIDGRVVLRVRGIASLSGEQRAKAIRRNIIYVASIDSIPADSLKLIVDDDRVEIVLFQDVIAELFEVDIALEQVSLKAHGNLVRQRIIKAIQSYRAERQSDYWIKSLRKAIIAGVILALFIMLIMWLIRRLDNALQLRIRARVDSLENISFNIIRSNQLWRLFRSLVIVFRIVIIVVSLTVGLNYIFDLFPWTRQININLFSFINTYLLVVGNAILRLIPNLIVLVIIFFATKYLLKLARLFFTRLQTGSIEINSFDRDWAITTFRIFKILVVVFAIVIAYPYIPGSDSSAFKGVTVFLGLLFSLGSPSFISNIIAGYTMTYRRAFKNGDRINVNGEIGFVDGQNLLVTRLRTIKNEEIVFPNSVLLNTSIVNYSTMAKDKGVIISAIAGIGYETPWRQVDAMLKEAAYRTEGLLKDPEPFVLKKLLGDYAITYEINVYCSDVHGIAIHQSRLIENILDVFNENNVQIMTPSYISDPRIPKVVPADQWNPPLAKKQNLER